MKIKNNKTAFTLIEMLVSISLIMIMTVIFIVNYRSANKRTDLIMTAQTMVADIHMAQNNALGLVKYGAVGVPAGGWGISIDTSGDYVIFADLNAPETIDYKEYNSTSEGERDNGARYNSISNDLEIESLTFSDGIATTTASTANVTFLPPDPKTNIYNPQNEYDYTSLEIKIKEKESGKTKTVKVNFLGLVEVID
ncbi:MAG: type II secretion system protein [Patescibacteria group bacterium]|jgi:type II secretory pathway pseudopilin PulG|nr:type II secretion system protein [Patescibacteria group bacterium]